MGYDFTNNKQSRQFYNKFNNPKYTGNAMFQIGTTNNKLASVPRDLESEYSSVRLGNNLPMFGFFKDLDGTEFTDISFPVSGISDQRALQIAKDKKQLWYFKIYPTGIAILVPTGLKPEKPVSSVPI